MKIHIRLALLIIFAVIVSSCTDNSAINSTPTSSTVPTESLATEALSTESPVTQSSAVDDKESFISALESSGATVEMGKSISQAFFSPEGRIIKVNGADVQAFEYESAEAMEKEASQVAPDGGSIGTSMVTWIDTPHFYKAGRIIVLYVGGDQTILSLLENMLGPQFAGV
jgi:hypothetical protein